VSVVIVVPLAHAISCLIRHATVVYHLSLFDSALTKS